MTKQTIEDFMYFFIQKISSRYNTGYEDSKLIALDLLKHNHINTYDLSNLNVNQ
jgi:hypothetical protein